MNRKFLLTGLILIILAIVLGAFGAHGLEGKIPAKKIASFETGVKYQMYHTLAMFLIIIIQTKFETKLVKWAYFLFLWGIILFSGSLYFLCTRNLFNADWLKVLGPITPIGGVLFVAGWLCFAFVGIKNKLI